MYHNRAITVLGPEGVHFRYPLLPMSWQGETDCFVGPFSSEEVALYFAKHVVAPRYGERYKVLPKRDDWYVQVGEISLMQEPASRQKVILKG